VENTWLGFKVNSHSGLAWLPDDKEVIITNILKAIEASDNFRAKQILEALGRLHRQQLLFLL
jgi:hypothetical protein